MFKHLTIKTRLIGVIAFLSLLAGALGGLGLRGMGAANDALKTVYEDRTVGLRYLGQIERSLSSNRIQLANALLNRTPEATRNAISRIEATRASEKKAWAAYLATAATAEEKQLSDKLEQQMQRMTREAIEPSLALLGKGDLDALHALYTTEAVRRLNTDARETLEKLVEIQTEVAKSEYEAAVGRYQTIRNTVIASMAVCVLLAALIGYFLVRAIVVPLNFAVSLADSVASGDLTQRIDCDRNDETGRLLRALKRMNESLSGLVRTVRAGVDTISTGSQQIASGNADLSQRTEEQASSLEETASSMEELASAVKQNAGSIDHANALADRASEVAGRAGVVVGEVVQTMSAIHQSSSRIVDIIGVIDGIAFQTNLLALNAAVEAARAGEQGRGFAVVASEVRTLAQRSASAAKEIKELIADSVAKVDTGTRLVNDAGATMQEVVESVHRVSEIMVDIAAATKEQSAGIDQVNEAVTQMDQVTQQNAALVEEAAAAAESMKEQAHQLSAAVAVFRLEALTDAPIDRLASVGMSSGSTHRRAPPRAANVSRLPNRVSSRVGATAAAAPKTGTDNWNEF